MLELKEFIEAEAAYKDAVAEFIEELNALNDAVVAKVPFNVFWDAV